MSKKSLILVVIQFSIFAFFAIAGKLFTTNIWLLLQFFALLLGLWGVLIMKLGRFNIQPEVKHNALMITRGPYKIIRNPMYAGLLLFFGISVFINFNIQNLLFSLIRLFAFFVLTIVLIMKIFMEEDFLTQKFSKNYIEYKRKTYRLVPFIF